MECSMKVLILTKFEMFLDEHIMVQAAVCYEGIDKLKTLIANYKEISVTPCLNASEIDIDYFNNLRKAFPNQLLYKLWLVITQDVNFGKTDRKEIDDVSNFKTNAVSF